MNESDFFNAYLPALELALKNDYINYGFDVKDPSWYIKKKIAKCVDDFEDEKFEKYKDLFVKVSLYFDAKSHGFEFIEGKSVKEFKKELILITLVYKEKFKIS